MGFVVLIALTVAGHLFLNTGIANVLFKPKHLKGSCKLYTV